MEKNKKTLIKRFLLSAINKKYNNNLYLKILLNSEKL